MSVTRVKKNPSCYFLRCSKLLVHIKSGFLNEIETFSNVIIVGHPGWNTVQMISRRDNTDRTSLCIYHRKMSIYLISKGFTRVVRKINTISEQNYGFSLHTSDSRLIMTQFSVKLQNEGFQNLYKKGQYVSVAVLQPSVFFIKQ